MSMEYLQCFDSLAGPLNSPWRSQTPASDWVDGLVQFRDVPELQFSI